LPHCELSSGGSLLLFVKPPGAELHALTVWEGLRDSPDPYSDRWLLAAHIPRKLPISLRDTMVNVTIMQQRLTVESKVSVGDHRLAVVLEE
jgi:hypothetical protein